MAARDALDIRVRRARILAWPFLCIYISHLVALIATYPIWLFELVELPQWGDVALFGCILAGPVSILAYCRCVKPNTPVQCPWCSGEACSFLSYMGASDVGRLPRCQRCGRSLADKLPGAGRPGKLTAKPLPWDDELA
jgi:hypothetical protein